MLSADHKTSLGSFKKLGTRGPTGLRLDLCYQMQNQFTKFKQYEH